LQSAFLPGTHPPSPRGIFLGQNTGSLFGGAHREGFVDSRRCRLGGYVTQLKLKRNGGVVCIGGEILAIAAVVKIALLWGQSN
jgi:hypothetical protein